MSYERTYTIDDVEFRVVFNATPLIPAQISGPPENWHEAEGGEVEILEIFHGDSDVDLSLVLKDSVEASLLEKINDDLSDITAPDFDEPDYDEDD